MYITGEEPKWNTIFFYNDSVYFENDEDLLEAMNTADDFAYTARLTSVVSFDTIRYDVITSYYSPQANLPRSGAQQLLRARNISTKNGFFSLAMDANRRYIIKPLGYIKNKELCLSRESFSMNLSDE